LIQNYEANKFSHKRQNKKEFKIKEKEGILRGISPKILGSSPARGTTHFYKRFLSDFLR